MEQVFEKIAFLNFRQLRLTDDNDMTVFDRDKKIFNDFDSANLTDERNCQFKTGKEFENVLFVILQRFYLSFNDKERNLTFYKNRTKNYTFSLLQNNKIYYLFTLIVKKTV